MRLKVLASSSKGNCYILSSPTGSLLLECGLPWKQIQKGLNFDLSNVLGCLITHEHKDHCKAVNELMNAGVDCYMSYGTADALGVHSYRSYFVGPGAQWNIGDCTIRAFDTEHDCVQPLGYFILYRPTGEKLLFLTDSYYSRYCFNGLNYIMVECNYIKDTLDANVEAGLIDEGMKRRLLQSHFSLGHVKQFFKANDLSKCRRIILLHLSDYNSDAGRMVHEIQELTGIDTVVAEPGLEMELQLYPY